MSTISPKTNNSGNKKILNAKALYTTKKDVCGICYFCSREEIIANKKWVLFFGSVGRFSN